jgi:hypothetical protein
MKIDLDASNKLSTLEDAVKWLEKNTKQILEMS